MLVEIKFKNFKSFKDETSMLLTNVKSFKEHSKTNLIETTNEFNLLKSNIIFGANASGKSNFSTVLHWMSRIIHSSYSDSLKKEEDRKLNDFQFKLNTSSQEANTLFEVSFLIKDIVYRYGFEINGFNIEKEWLYKKKDREVYLFTRNAKDKDIRINSVSFKEGIRYKNDVNKNVLFISHLAQNNQRISGLVLNWFRQTNSISALRDHQYSRYTAFLLKNNSHFKKWASKILKYLEITSVESGEKDNEILTYHKRYDDNNLLVDTIAFDVANTESEGTKKLIYLLGPIYDTLRFGKRLIIDEFDARLHHNLVVKLLELFHKYNLKGAQLILTAHNVSLLNKDIFRRDQIWFVDKDQFGVSKLYSLSDFNSSTVRNNSAFDKKYIEKEFGAAETMIITKDLIDTLYGEA